jgi:hypothetical protein
MGVGLRLHEVQRTHLLGNSVNKGRGEGFELGA